MKIGNISFNLEAVKDISKEDFIQHYRGLLDGVDIEQAFEKIQNELNKNKPTEEKEETKKAPKKK
jgi:hypothetical protein